jgi:hypothetical protein
MIFIVIIMIIAVSGGVMVVVEWSASHLSVLAVAICSALC